MAFDNEILVGRYNRFLQRYFGMKGGPPARQLGSEVMPVHSFFSGVENRNVEGWKRYVSQQDILGVSGLTNAAKLRNPVGSGVLAVIEDLMIAVSPNTVGATDVINVRLRANFSDVNLSSAASCYPYDRRIDKFSTCIQSFDNAGNQTGVFLMAFPLTLASSPFRLISASENQEIVLSPGQWILVHNTVAQTHLWVNMVFRERPIEEGEQEVVFP